MYKSALRKRGKIQKGEGKFSQNNLRTTEVNRYDSCIPLEKKTRT